MRHKKTSEKSNKWSIIIVLLLLAFLYKTTCSNTAQIAPEIKNVINLVYILLLIVVVIFYISRKYNVDIEKIFLYIALPIGFIYMLLVPPGIVPDEWYHMQTTYSISSQLMGIEKEGKLVLREDEYNYICFQTEEISNDRYVMLYSNSISQRSGNYIQTGVDSTSLTNITGYFPAVVMVTMSRLIGLDAITTIYLGRMASLIFYIFVVYIAIKKLPFMKKPMFMIALFPMACQQMMSYSYDVIINSMAFLSIACSLKMVYASKTIRPNDIILYLIATFLLFSNKGSVYAVISLIPILVRYGQLGRLEKTQKAIAILACVVFFLIINYNTIISPAHNNEISNLSNSVVNWSGTPSYSISWMIANTFKACFLYGETLFRYGFIYLFSMFGSNLFWLSIDIPVILTGACILLTILISYFEDNFSLISKKHKFIYIIIVGIIVLATMTAMAIANTPIDYPTIEGVQGRYFIPIAYLMTLCFSKSGNRGNHSEKLLDTVPILIVLSVYFIMTKCFI